MALERTLVSPTGNFFLCIPKNPIKKTQIPALSLNRHPSYPAKESRFSRNLKCSVDRHHNQAVEYAKPAEIPWKKELCNTVQLIGIVGTPVEIKHLPSGKVLAWTRLAVKKSATDTSW